MRNLTVTLCLTIAVLLGNAGVSWGIDSLNIDTNNKGSKTEKQDPIHYPTLDITNYPATIHGGVRATWGITQAQDGRMYFANTHGILVFDGETWRGVEAKGAALGRSITTDSEGYVIAGTVGDVGVVQSDNAGRIAFKSLLRPSAETVIKKTTVYETLNIGRRQYLLRTKTGLYKYDSKLFKKLKTPKGYRFGVSTQIDGVVYIYVYKTGLFKLKNEVLTQVKGTEHFSVPDKTINAVLKGDGYLVLVTRRSGIYTLKKGVTQKITFTNPTLEKTKVYRAISLRGGGYAIATYDGIFILDAHLNVTQHIARDTGLMTNNVRSLYQDLDGNLWAGLNDGISKISVTNELRFFERDMSRINSIVNGMAFFNDEFYIATSTGLMKSKVDHLNQRQTFIPIHQKKYRTQTWSILNGGDNLFVGSNYGLGMINKKGKYTIYVAKKVSGSVYNLKPSKLFKDHLFVGSAKGLSLVNAIDGGKSYRKLPLPDKGPVWQLRELPEKREVWATIPGKGLYRVEFSASSKRVNVEAVYKYTDTHGLPNKSLRRTRLFTINGNILIGTRNGVYKFDRAAEQFTLDDRFSVIPDYETKNVVVSKNLTSKTHWIGFEDSSTGVRKLDFYKVSNDFKFEKLPLDKLLKFSRLKLFLHKDFVILSGTEGMAVIEKDIKSPIPTGKTLVTELRVNDVTLYERAPFKVFSGGNIKLKDTFAHNENKISVRIAATDYANEKRNKYRYRLLNFEKTWHVTGSNEITYTNLQPGKYVLSVQSVNSNDQDLLPFEYKFTITSPWWHSTYFYVAEIVFFLTLLFFTVLIKQNTRVEKLATALTFVVIIIIFEYLNLLLDPLILELSGGVPVFTLISKVILGVMLQPTEMITSRSLDWCSERLPRNINS